MAQRSGQATDVSTDSALEVPPWLPNLSIALCVVGMCIAAYLTYEHFTDSTTLACSDVSVFNCLKVTTSQWSYVFGIPVALLGLVYFVVALPFCLPWAWRAPLLWLHYLRLAGSVSGVAFVCYLVYCELFKIGAICPFCTGVHIVTFLLFCTIAFGTALMSPGSQLARRE